MSFLQAKSAADFHGLSLCFFMHPQGIKSCWSVSMRCSLVELASQIVFRLILSLTLRSFASFGWTTEATSVDASRRSEGVAEQFFHGFHPIHRSVSCDEGRNTGSFRVLTVHRFGDRDESGGHRRPSPSMAFVSGLWATHSSREWSSPCFL